MNYVKTPVYNVQGDQLLTESTFDQIKESTEADAKTLDVIINEIKSDVSTLKESGSESVTQNIQQVTENVTNVENRVEAVEQDYAKTEYVNKQDSATLESAKKLVDEKIIISTVDLEDGVSSLESGKLYVVY